MRPNVGMTAASITVTLPLEYFVPLICTRLTLFETISRKVKLCNGEYNYADTYRLIVLLVITYDSNNTSLYGNSSTEILVPIYMHQ